MSKPSLAVPTSFQVSNGGQISNGGNQNGEKKVGYINYELEPGFTIRLRQDIDPATIDPMILKQIISNRVSAQKSRLKKHQYVESLKKKTMELQMQANVKRSQLEMLRGEYQCLVIEHMEVEERVFATFQRFNSAKAEFEAAIAEIKRLEKKRADLV